MRRPLFILAILFAVGCETADVPTSPSEDPGLVPSGSSATTTSADLTFCAQETNRYRGMAGVPAVRQSGEIEAYAAEAARFDGMNHAAHGYSNRANLQVRAAENEIPWWPLSPYGSIRAVIQAGLALFWNEGPGGGHYEIMRGSFSAVGCGVFVNGNEVTVVQHFR